MKQVHSDDLESYYRDAATWSEDRAREIAASRRIAWIVAVVAASVALLAVIALVVLTPLKTSVPFVLMVDRQTGYATRVDPLDATTLSADAALTQSFLVQYIAAREAFDIDSLRESYRKVALWSAPEARNSYMAIMQASSPLSPLASLPRRAIVDVQVLSVSSIDGDTAMVRFTTTRTDPGTQPQDPQYWVSVISFRYSAAEMSAEDRLVNPLGFQVTRYRRTAETPPLPPPDPAYGNVPARSRSQQPSAAQTAQPGMTP